MLSEKLESSEDPLEKSPARDFFQCFDWSQGVMEWGAPHGQMARWMPAWVISRLGKDCLWVMDRKDLRMYPSAWRDLGVNLEKVHFLYEEKPLRSFKSLIHDHPFSFLVLDTGDFLKSGDLNFITQLTRQSHKPCFLMRHFYLSHRNGNPFARYRFNSFYDFQRHHLRLISLKGKFQSRPFQIPLRSFRRGGQ